MKVKPYRANKRSEKQKLPFYLMELCDEFKKHDFALPPLIELWWRQNSGPGAMETLNHIKRLTREMRRERQKILKKLTKTQQWILGVYNFG